MKVNLNEVSQTLAAEKQRQSILRRHRNRIIAVLIPICLIVVSLCYLWGIVIVSGSSMSPSVQDSDIVLFNRRFSEVQRGDIIVAKDPLRGIYYIKRVIGVSGNIVDLKDGSVYVDGKQLHEDYIFQNTLPHDEVFPITVPNGSVFVLGDSRGVSQDSRNTEIGMIKNENIIGRVIFIFRSI